MNIEYSNHYVLYRPIKKPDAPFYFNYRIVPYDKLMLVTSRFDRTEPYFTFLSYDSLYFASFLEKRLKSISYQGARAIDMCCGVGIQALTLSPFCSEVFGVDINPHAIELSKLNASLNEISNCMFSISDINALSETMDNQFDLIVSNPPFIFSDNSTSKTVDSYGGEPFGLGLTIEILKKSQVLLSKKGRVFIITRTPLFEHGDYLYDNMTRWLGSDFGWIYHYISDYIVPLEPFEKKLGVKGYRQVILEIYRGIERKFIRYPFWHRATSLF